MPLVGFMSGRSPPDSSYMVAAFRQGLAEGGFAEGQNVAIEFRWAHGDYSRLSALAAELVARNPAVLVSVGGDASPMAAKAATSTIPIVFGMGGDPVRSGLVQSFSHPGGNATGFTLLTNELEAKRLGLLHELMPQVALVGVLVNPKFPPAVHQIAELEAAARKIDRTLFIARAADDDELATAFATLSQQRVGALLVAADPYFDTRRERITGFALQGRLPAFYHFREYALAGGLVSYGPRVSESYRQAGVYTGRILKGAKPADLPVVQTSKFELVVNLATARAIGVAFPPSLLARADELIE
jgi:putative tryptophan/tyrosine transport system substrate-binding protein